MTDKKNNKKTTEKTVKSESELRKELIEARRGLIEGTLQNPHKIKALRKEIARSKTLINQGKGA